jgi:type I restriction enzyme M protein
VIQDPAAGTGGVPDRRRPCNARAHDDGYFTCQRLQTDSSSARPSTHRECARHFRLLLMNLHLHRVDPTYPTFADTLPRGRGAPYKMPTSSHQPALGPQAARRRATT